MHIQTRPRIHRGSNDDVDGKDDNDDTDQPGQRAAGGGDVSREPRKGYGQRKIDGTHDAKALFQRVFTCKDSFRYSRERASQSLPKNRQNFKFEK